MIVRPVLPDSRIKQALAPSLAKSAWEWEEILLWIMDRVACIWAIGNDAWAVTAANDENEIDIVVCGGSGALQAARPFLAAMSELPQHKGKTLRIEGRPGWRRFCEDWQCETDGESVILTKVV